jgi:hypothetical protein
MFTEFKLVRSMMGALVVAILMAGGSLTLAQQGSPQDQAQLVVSGQVQDIYTSAYSNEKVLVQILVQSSAAARFEHLKNLAFPAPGNSLFIEVDRARLGINLDRDITTLPNPGTFIRARLSMGSNQQWTANSLAAFEVVDAEQSAIAGDVLADEGLTANGLGLTVEVNLLETGKALRVTAVRPNSAAQAAGIEVGDTLVQANDVALTDARRFDNVIRESQGKLTVVVRDVRTGREVPVSVPMNLAMKPSISGGRELGLTTELAFFQGEPALKVTAVEAHSPAEQAGIRVGLLILQADGAALQKPEALTEAGRNATGPIVLKTYDPSARREGSVTVDLR